MSDGRTIWWAKDAGWWRREGTVELGEEFGAAGPAVIDWLSCEAKLQHKEDGSVVTGVKSISRGCFVTPDVTCHVLSRAAQLGVLDDFVESNGRVTCRISGWRTDQPRGRAAIRKADSRAKAAATVTDAVTPSPDVPSREEERRESSTAATRMPAGGEGIDLQLVADVRNAFADFGPDGCTIDEISVVNAMARFPNADYLQAALGCAEYLRSNPDRDPGMTYGRFLETGARRDATRRQGPQPGKHFDGERENADAYDGLVTQ